MEMCLTLREWHLYIISSHKLNAISFLFFEIYLGHGGKLGQGLVLTTITLGFNLIVNCGTELSIVTVSLFQTNCFSADDNRKSFKTSADSKL